MGVCKVTYKAYLAAWAWFVLWMLLWAPLPAAAQEGLYVFDQDFPPYSFVENGQATGFEVDLLLAAAQAQGIKLTPQPMNWDRAQAALASGEARVASGMSPTSQRKASFRFLQPPTANLQVLAFVRPDSGIQTLDDLKGKRVATEKGATYEGMLRARPGVILHTFSSETMALKALAEGEVQAFVGAGATARYNIAKLGLAGLSPLPESLAQLPMHIVLKAGDDQLANRLEEGLRKMKASGQWERLEAKWFQP